MTNYFENVSLSFSSLKNLNFGPGLFKAMLTKKPSSESLTCGNLVDALLTEPENFNNLFIEEKEKEPSGLLLSFGKCLLDCNGDYESAYRCSGFKQTFETVKEKFDKEHLNWYNEQREIRGGKKLPYSSEEYDKAVRVVESLQRNDAVSSYFKAQENEEVFKQLEIFWEYKDVQLKSKLDLVKIDKNNKIIYIIDLKTTGFAVDSFKESIEKYQYWLQLYMYGLAFYYKFKNEIPNIEEYKCKFKWIVESTKYPGSPCIFNMSPSDELKAENGGIINGKYYKGFKELISDYKWYLEHDQWIHKRELIENQFEVDISVFN